MSRVIAISDIHGCLDEFNLLLKKIKYNIDRDMLFLLGDYMDKGKNPKKTLETIMSMNNNYGVRVIGGNHEDIFYNWCHNNDHKRNPYFKDIVGGLFTAKSYCPHLDVITQEMEARQYVRENYSEHLQFIESLPHYIETNNFIFVHAGIDPTKKDWKDTSLHDFKWIRQDFLFNENAVDKLIVFGHTSSYRLHGIKNNFSPWTRDNKIGIDGGCIYGGQLNCLIIDEENNITYDFVPYQGL